MGLSRRRGLYAGAGSARPGYRPDQTGELPPLLCVWRVGAGKQEGTMIQERLAQLIHEQPAAIAALERRISTHAAIMRILRVLVLEELMTSQALRILAETAERSPDQDLQALYQHAIADLRQMQAD